jgi:hypothetical protein
MCGGSYPTQFLAECLRGRKFMPIEEAKRAAGIPERRRVRIVEYPRQRLLPLPRLASWVSARIAGGAGVRLGEELEYRPWTYEQRALACILRSPGVPLLLTPASLLPDEPAAR